MQEADRLGLSIADAARTLGVGRTTIYRLVDTGELQSFKVGRRRLIVADSIKRYIDSHKVGWP